MKKFGVFAAFGSLMSLALFLSPPAAEAGEASAEGAIDEEFWRCTRDATAAYSACKTDALRDFVIAVEACGTDASCLQQAWCTYLDDLRSCLSMQQTLMRRCIEGLTERDLSSSDGGEGGVQ
jgi:hypothetical protein